MALRDFMMYRVTCLKDAPCPLRESQLLVKLVNLVCDFFQGGGAVAVPVQVADELARLCVFDAALRPTVLHLALNVGEDGGDVVVWANAEGGSERGSDSKRQEEEE